MVVCKDAAKLIRPPAKNHTNYWSPLNSLVNKQEDKEDEEDKTRTTPELDRILSAQAGTSHLSKVAAHWV